MTAVKRVIAATLLSGAVVGSLALAGTASADAPEEDALLAGLAANGITYSNVPAVINNAHHACADLDNGIPSSQIASQIATATTGGTQAEAVHFVNVAVATLCPQNAGK